MYLDVEIVIKNVKILKICLFIVASILILSSIPTKNEFVY